MGFGKNLAISILNLFLIVSLSTAIMSLTFTLILTEDALNKIVDNGLEPFINNQIETAFETETAQTIRARHSSALATCEINDRYEIGSNGDETIYLDCDEIKGTTPDQFMESIKTTVKEYALDPVRQGLNTAVSQLNYFKIALWISAALSFILIIITIVIAQCFPFKSFGVTGLIAGSPFIAILSAKHLIVNEIQKRLESAVPAEVIEQVSQSPLMQQIHDLISNLVNGMAVGFAALFFVGLILLIVGLILAKKQPKTSPNPKQSLPNSSQ